MRTSLLIYVNGEPRELPAETSLQTLIESLGFAAERVAAELNGTVVPRARWTDTSLNDGDRVEIVHFVGGGYFA